MIRFVILALALIGIVALPYPLSALLTFLAAVVSPLAGVSLGIMTDALYFTSGTNTLPLASILGLVATVGAFFGQRFVRTHLIQVSP